MIHKDVKELLNVPDYYFDEVNTTPMQNFWPLVERVFNKFPVQRIVEIGSERGISSKKLIEYCHEFKAELCIVDPVINDELQSDLHIKKFPEKSLEFFQRKIEADCYFIDGDHNYYTVINELENCKQNKIKNKPLVIFAHDIGWPWAYRDLYYKPEEIEEKHPYVENKSMCLEDHEIKETGIPMRIGGFASHYGGEKNGVLKAFEDFLEKYKGEWTFLKIPTLFGLGILIDKENLTKEQLDFLTNLEIEFKNWKPLLGILEANRLRLLQEFNQLYDTAEERLEEIKKIDTIKNELYNTAEERLNEINKLVKVNKELFNTAENRLNEISILVKKDKELFETAENRLNEINNLVSRVETLNSLVEEYRNLLQSRRFLYFSLPEPVKKDLREKPYY